MPLSLRSAVFRPLGAIPPQHTCDGADRAPPLDWKGAPAATKSFALIVDDPDSPDPAAPTTTFVHWVLYDLPAATKSLPEVANYPAGTRQGRNDWGRTGYGGPCPERGQHHYFFKLYALDIVLGNLRTPTKAQIEKAMQAHILEKAQLMGTYEKRP